MKADYVYCYLEKGFVRMEKFSLDGCSYAGLKDYVHGSIIECINAGKFDDIDFNDGLIASSAITSIIYVDNKIYFGSDAVESVLALLNTDKDLMALVARWTPYFSDKVASMVEMVWLILYHKVFIENYGTLRDMWRKRAVENGGI